MIKTIARAVLLAFLSVTLLPSLEGTSDAHAAYARKYSARARYKAARIYRRNRMLALRAAAVSAAKAQAGHAQGTPQRPLKLLTRDQILASDPVRLERLGNRLVVGFQSFSEVRPLVEKKAIAGIFITDRNVRGRKAADVAKDIQDLQNIRRAQGMPRLIVAADQEGGYVSRLSPPLKWQPTLGMIIAKLKTDNEREKAVRDYAEAQARELDRLGITMNFGPVVDLRLGAPSRNDGETRIYWRAIDSDPYLVAKVAGWYCDTLTKFNIICTLKHFPGLGRVARDTHVTSGELTAKQSQLELSDWLPFRRVMTEPGIATMVGHVRVDAVDKETPASFSDAVINTVIRPRFENDGLLITDDFSMGAVTGSKDGLGGAAVKALNAGVDLILLCTIDGHYDILMSALIEADIKGETALARESESNERLKRYVFVDDRELPPSTPLQAEQTGPAISP
ncbi:glycoside hydrolase family 3 N-terminal domain-containing protein [Hyphomicrobium sp. 99]|uniref:glycoside hydrolase family 3 N-terminal domain-containing protein n=1 Tax=Hyphomicrobium sp. 99 TaxID=1163419 RepID=UPI0005F82051|nr:glycoside hydrolase family 3 N-terminal domain-containing protein [Hyphomicrobium sp. 99]